MQSLVKHLSITLNRLPRLSISRLNHSPVFNLYDAAYIQGVLFWSFLPIFCLCFWLCLYVVFGCVWCCYGSQYVVTDSSRVRFYRRLVTIAAFVCHFVSCAATMFLVFGSERLHSTAYQIVDGVNEVNRNFTRLNYTALEVTKAVEQYVSQNNLSEFESGSMNILHSHSIFSFANDFSRRIEPITSGLKRMESIRWICVISFTSKFCLLTILLCTCCQLTARKRFSWVSFAMILLTIFVYGLLCVFYIPGTIAISDFCVNPEQTYLSLAGNSSKDYYDIFSHYYSCKSEYFNAEMSHLQKLVANVQKKTDSRSQRTLDGMLALLRHFAEELPCTNTSQTLHRNQSLLCDDACLYIIICTIAIGVLSISIPGMSMLLKCLAHHEVFRHAQSDIKSIGAMTTDRIRRALRRDSRLAVPSAPPSSANQNRRKVAKPPRQKRRDSSNHRNRHSTAELQPMLPPRVVQIGKTHSPPPPYDDS